MVGLIVLGAFIASLDVAAIRTVVPLEATGLTRAVTVRVAVSGTAPIHLLTGTGSDCETATARVVTMPKTTPGGPAVQLDVHDILGGKQPIPARIYTVTNVALPAGKALCVQNTAAQPVHASAETKP